MRGKANGERRGGGKRKGVEAEEENDGASPSFSSSASASAQEGGRSVEEVEDSRCSARNEGEIVDERGDGG